jgi:hypothetical protein
MDARIYTKYFYVLIVYILTAHEAQTSLQLSAWMPESTQNNSVLEAQASVQL